VPLSANQINQNEASTISLPCSTKFKAQLVPIQHNTSSLSNQPRAVHLGTLESHRRWWARLSGQNRPRIPRTLSTCKSLQELSTPATFRASSLTLALRPDPSKTDWIVEREAPAFPVKAPMPISFWRDSRTNNKGRVLGVSAQIWIIQTPLVKTRNSRGETRLQPT